MDKVLIQLQNAFPGLDFVPGKRFSWSPANRQVIYNKGVQKSEPIAIWSLFHELGHALLDHQDFSTDFQLLRLEADAWSKAKELATDFGHTIDSNHIQDCLDTYRDWLYQRSTCPACTNTSLQTKTKVYNCFNCGTVWRVSSSRLCRAYRRTSSEKALI